MSTMKEVDQESRYDILQNEEGDILIIINSRAGGPENPRFVYDGGATALLYRTKIVLSFLKMLQKRLVCH